MKNFTSTLKNRNIDNDTEVGFTVFYSAERSIQDELNRQSQSDIVTILLSYGIMFLYVTLTLGHIRSIRTLWVDMKISVGFVGVLLVLFSVISSIGFYSYCGIPGTLIIFEVIPFLVLAVGVDNIFILVHHSERFRAHRPEDIEQSLALTLSSVGPSIFLTATSESIAFILGSLTPMPAVQVFSYYASLAVFIDFILQITCFVAVLSLDARRHVKNQVDLCCCISLDLPPEEEGEKTPPRSLLQRFFATIWTPAVLGSFITRVILFCIFIALACLSAASVHRISAGLDQKLSMPKDSYVLNYFYGLENYLSVGPPVYFVVNEDAINYTNVNDQDLLCGTSGCSPISLLGQVGQALRQPDLYYLAQPPSSWLDDYFDWLSSSNDPPCCRIHNSSKAFCPATSNATDCISCPIQFIDRTRPSREDFERYVEAFLSDNPGIKCPKGGHAAYHDGVQIINHTYVKSSYFMGFHSILKTSPDFIGAMKSANEIAKNISRTISNNHSKAFEDSKNLKDYPVFPYR